jgi:class 3 adenylate cyclase/tetratricopeptide (TPR) repeat protein
MRCSRCGNDNREGRKFCAQCGQPLKLACPSCDAPNEPQERFCGDCGAALVVQAQAGAIQPPGVASTAPDIRIISAQAEGSLALEGERKTVTALFADIKGSTELMRDLDPEEARAIVDPVLQLMMAPVHRYGGYVAQSTGDGIFALFGAPVAHEDHPQRALHAALAMQEELHRYADRLRAEGKIPVEARVGVNTGEVVVRSIETGGHTEYTPVGHVTNLAARMQTVAPAGSIAVSETTQRLCEGYFEFRAQGPTAVKGLDAPVEVYEVLRAGPLRTHFELSARRGLTRFVGREREIAELKRALELAQSGHGQIVAAVAEAGTGKSRLFYEFKAALPDDRKVMEAYSVSTGKAAPYQPVLELLHSYFTFEAADDPAARRAKIATRLKGLDPTLNDISPYLFALLGIQDTPDPLTQLDPAIKRRRTLEALKRIVLYESVNQPLLLIFEDLHWIDSQTQALLDLLADSIANACVLLLVDYRPEYRHQWAGKSYYTQLGLSPLGQESAEELLAALLGDAAELGPLKRLVADKSGGNPFFIEELVQGFFDEGVLTRNGGVRMTRPLGQVRIPPTVQGILSSRIDRLPSEEKGVLQTLAVLGKDIPLNLVRHVTPLSESELSRICSDLQAGEFIYEQPSLAGSEYTFKHALTQDVAYNSVLLERRRVLHERAGNAIEALYAGALGDHLAELAHHYARSANLRKAVHYLGRAGRQAFDRHALSEARVLLNRGLELLKELPDDTERARKEIDLLGTLSYTLLLTADPGASEREAAAVRAKELCERLGDETSLIKALTELANLRMNRGELQQARELAEQAVASTERAEDPGLVAGAHFQLGEVVYVIGEFATAREHLERAIQLLGSGPYRNIWETMWAGRSTEWLIRIAVICGYPATALERGRDALSVARRSLNPTSLGIALDSNAWTNCFLGNIRKTQEFADQMLALAADHDMPLWRFFGNIWRGWSLAAQGQEEGIAMLQRARQAAVAAPLLLLNVLRQLAEGFLFCSRPDEGLAVAAEGLALARRTAAGTFEPGLLQTKGALLLLHGTAKAAEAENCFRQVIRVGQSHGAKLWELHASTSLARLLRDTNRRDEARAMLSDIYGRFTEGFDTADLKDARTLLDELSS